MGYAREWLDPYSWIPWDSIVSVLCLASAGGQQAPAFATLGYRVTSFDLSPQQLELDHKVAQRCGLDLECVQGDMLDLSCLHGRMYDLVYQAVSACYAPDVRRLYRQVSRVMRPHACYWVEHWNPYRMQVERCGWDGKAYRIGLPQERGVPVEFPWSVWDANGRERQPMLRHYIHSLHDLLGGLGDAGFHIVRFAERYRGTPGATPGSYRHMNSHVPPFFTLLAEYSGPAPR
ncbi:class I SAM-dependent methyltransferase [Paraburkholderia youngii]|uniref:SAM-dependent methyltransferase n=1 Tax=Paraburkholderia youngii TaxID=2782701 RepID=A0A7W8L935_9BURK|nr:class I SAM-dependent methyltransferase [Paraburkholderia youngii]MBB5402649.1 SAM-dependent methyltransferase [Paraburkholderia youngii]